VRQGRCLCGTVPGQRSGLSCCSSSFGPTFMMPTVAGGGGGWGPPLFAFKVVVWVRKCIDVRVDERHLIKDLRVSLVSRVSAFVSISAPESSSQSISRQLARYHQHHGSQSCYHLRTLRFMLILGAKLTIDHSTPCMGTSQSSPRRRRLVLRPLAGKQISTSEH
jgi:hypothetical protein